MNEPIMAAKTEIHVVRLARSGLFVTGSDEICGAWSPDIEACEAGFGISGPLKSGVVISMGRQCSYATLANASQWLESQSSRGVARCPSCRCRRLRSLQVCVEQLW